MVFFFRLKLLELYDRIRQKTAAHQTEKQATPFGLTKAKETDEYIQKETDGFKYIQAISGLPTRPQLI